MNEPACPSCAHVFSWPAVLRQVLGPVRATSSLWGVRCPGCGIDLKVPTSRIMLIFALAIFFGSQTSTLLLVSDLGRFEFWLAKLGMILAYYAIAVFFILKLESVE